MIEDGDELWRDGDNVAWWFAIKARLERLYLIEIRRSVMTCRRRATNLHGRESQACGTADAHEQSKKHGIPPHRAKDAIQLLNRLRAASRSPLDAQARNAAFALPATVPGEKSNDLSPLA